MCVCVCVCVCEIVAQACKLWHRLASAVCVHVHTRVCVCCTGMRDSGVTRSVHSNCIVVSRLSDTKYSLIP